MSEISARCFLFVGNISATICKNLIFKIFYLVRKVFLICAKSDTEVKHWHGAKKDSWFSHIATEMPGEECSNEWCEPVTDEEYNKLG